MTDTENILQKQAAVDTHSVQAAQFQSRYDREMLDPYATCFAYSRLRLNLWLERFLPRPSRPLSLLDIGCGTGHHMKALAARGYDVSGVDGSDKMLAVAQEINPGADVRQADVDRLPHADASFDRVLSIEVFRYLPDLGPSSSEMVRVLKPGGEAIITAAPLFQANGYALVNPITRALPGLGLTALKQFFHSSGRLRRELRQAGFKEVWIHGVYTGPFIWLERLVPPLVRPALQLWGPIDAVIADLGPFREFANMFVIRAVK